MNVVLRDEARSEIVNGASFFDGQREGLADCFVNRVFEDLGTMQSHTHCFMNSCKGYTANL